MYHERTIPTCDFGRSLGQTKSPYRKETGWASAAQTRKIVALTGGLNRQFIEKERAKLYQKVILPFAAWSILS